MVIPSEKLCAIILTYNEEDNIERVLSKLDFLKRVIVIDSFSSDSTIKILNGFPNVEIYQRVFDTHATQWNYGLSKSNSEWILSLDADYILSQSFISEIPEKLQQTEFAAFDAQFDFLVFGKKLLSNNTTPRPVLFQNALCQYFDDGHTQRLHVEGKTGSFQNRIEHDDRKPLTRWLANQAGYSMKESNMLLATPASQLNLISKIRKTKIFAPFFVFFYCLFVQGLIFNGWRGWHYTLQRTIVEMLFALRLIEKEKLK